MKTIRQIADEIGVSKQAVYKRYKGKLHTVCAPYAHTEQGVLYLSEQAETLIKQDFLKDDRSNGAHTERSIGAVPEQSQEAGVVAVVYAFIIGIFVYKTIKLKDIPRILVKGAATTAVSLFIIAMASIFSWFLAWESFPETVVNVMQALTSNGTVALCMVILFLFVLGLFVEGIPVLIVFAPILVPAMEAYGIDTLYFGIVLVLTVLVGSITPPVGSLLYLGSSIAKTTVSKAGKEVWIFVAMIMSVIGLLVIFPQIVLFLPDLLYN